MTSTLSLDDISVLDKQIEQLNEYKPIPEHEVKNLCDKVGKVNFETILEILTITHFYAINLINCGG